ncbi:MAG: flagellar hook-length control protein FliK [Lachnospiraceae bacterium]|nr:flagellar hook-length control protein FliK [Lachnospiraceae bacterium]
MGTAPIKDVMFSLPIGNGSDIPGKTETAGDLFAKVMNDAASKTAQTAATSDSSAQIRQADGNRMGVRKAETAQSKGIKDDRSGSGTSDAVGKEPRVRDSEQVSKAVDEKIETVKDAIKEELGVSDEQIEDAMAVLNLTQLDLLDPDSLKGLMLELAGEEDPLALVTNGDLLTSINNVTDIVINAVNDLEEEFDITPEELTQIIETVKESEAGIDEMPLVKQAETDPAAIKTEVPKEDDEDESKLKTPASQTGQSETPIIRENSGQTVNMQKKAGEMMDDRKQESKMQDAAVEGQELKTDTMPRETGEVLTASEPQPSYVDAQSILDQVRDQMKVSITPDQTSMELQLHPASLGTVNLTVSSNGGVVTANILVQNEAVKAVLEGQLTQLLQTFEEQGQKVEAIEVAVAGYDLDRSLNQGNEQGEARGQDRRSEGIGSARRRRINLNELNEEDLEDLTEEDRLAAEMMDANGTSVDYQA